MRLTIFVAILGLTSCASEVPAVREARQLEKEFALVDRAGTARERCALAGQVADAWRRALDEEAFRSWSSIRAVHCRAVAQGR